MECRPPEASLPSRAITILRWVLVSWVATALFLQLDVGLADNGDFIRSAKGLSSGPCGMENVTRVDDPRYRQRYFDHYLPYWTAHPKGLVHGYVSA